jgi:hypothetical protein
MLELSGIGSVLRGIGILYWLLAIGAVGLAIWKGRSWQRKALWVAIAVAVFGFLPAKAMIEQYQRNAYAREAWAYFKKLCDEKSGEKIYKTFTGVKSVLVVKPLPPATDKDHYDQFWYGDPYSASATSKRAESAAVRLASDWRHRTGTGTQKGLDFVEMKDELGNGYIKINRPMANDKLAVRERIERPVSRFGVAWEDISKPEDRKYWVAASRLRVIDLSDNSIVAERFGYLIEAGFGSTSGGRRPWLTARGIGPNGGSCPYAGDATDQWFIASVFKQVGEQ